MAQLLGHSITYRIAVGSQAGVAARAACVPVKFDVSWNNPGLYPWYQVDRCWL